MPDVCPECGGALDCLAGESAHPLNWYCSFCSWEAWNPLKPRPLTRENNMKHFLKRLRYANIMRCREWMGEPPHRKNLAFHGLELGGEVGEAQNVMKKLDRWVQDIPGKINPSTGVPMLAEELADIIVCVDIIAAIYDINLEESVTDKFNKTSDKHNFATHL